MEQDDLIRQIFEEGIAKAREQRMRTSIEPTLRVERPRWEFERSYVKSEIIEKALEMGWSENAVQVKQHQLGPDLWEYYIEPYEADCNCPSLLKYEDYAPDKAENDG